MEEPLFSKLSEMLIPTILALYFLISAHKYTVKERTDQIISMFFPMTVMRISLFR